MNDVTSQAHIPIISNEVNVGSAKSVIDIGGGVGRFACAIANRFPNINVTVLDQSSNEELAKMRANTSIEKTILSAQLKNMGPRR